MKRLQNVSVRLTYPTNNERPSDNQSYAKIRITDESSGIEMMSVELEPAEFFSMMAGLGGHGDADVAEAPDRWGRTLVVDQIRIPDGYGLDHRADNDTPGVRAAIEAVLLDGWQTATYRRQNGHHYLIVRKWTEHEEKGD
jgi:hypothetical protein